MSKYYKLQYRSPFTGNWVYLKGALTKKTLVNYRKNYKENVEFRILTFSNILEEEPVKIKYL